jgi:hypothetical protein
MKIYLDDERESPEGWILVKSVTKMIKFLEDLLVGILFGVVFAGVVFVL